jgi:hypothetical protein
MTQRYYLNDRELSVMFYDHVTRELGHSVDQGEYDKLTEMFFDEWLEMCVETKLLDHDGTHFYFEQGVPDDVSRTQLQRYLRSEHTRGG